jgi:protein-tyrosine phosphatase
MENEWQIQQVVEGLFIGSRHCREEENWELKTHNIGVVVDLSNLQGLPAVPDGCQLIEVAIDDKEDQQITPVLRQVLQVVVENHERSNKAAADSNYNSAVLIHCSQGISRSASCVLAVLMVQHKMTLKEAYKLLREKRRTIHPNSGFLKELIALEREVHDGIATCEIDGLKILWK